MVVLIDSLIPSIQSALFDATHHQLVGVGYWGP